MKAINLIPIIAISFLLIGCGKEKVSCTNEEALNLLKAAYKEANASKYYFRYNNKYGLYDYNEAVQLLKNGNVSVPKNKLYHEDNEDFLSVLDNTKISFDNIITNEVNKDVNAYACTTDVFYEFKNKDGELVNLNKTGVSYYVYPMNDGEKIGIEYNEGSIENTRVDLVKYLTIAAGLEKPFDIVFTNEELKIISEQAELKRLRIEKAEADEVVISEIYVRLSNELPPGYLDKQLEKFAEKLIADNYFNGQIVKNSDVLIESYAKQHKLEMDELMKAQKIIESSEPEKTVIEDNYPQDMDEYMALYIKQNNMNNTTNRYQDSPIDEELASARDLIANTNKGIYDDVSETLLAQFNGNDFGHYFCEKNAFEFIGQSDVENNIAIGVCNRFYKRYGPSLMSTEIPFLDSILSENGLYLNSVSLKK